MGKSCKLNKEAEKRERASFPASLISAGEDGTLMIAKNKANTIKCSSGMEGTYNFLSSNSPYYYSLKFLLPKGRGGDAMITFKKGWWYSVLS